MKIPNSEIENKLLAVISTGLAGNTEPCRHLAIELAALIERSEEYGGKEQAKAIRERIRQFSGTRIHGS